MRLDITRHLPTAPRRAGASARRHRRRAAWRAHCARTGTAVQAGDHAGEHTATAHHPGGV